MKVKFLNILWQVLGHSSGESIISTGNDSISLSNRHVLRSEEAIDWNAILEKSGTNQLALHLFMIGVCDEETMLQR